MYKEYNPNPLGIQGNDCVVRALTKVLDKPWDQVYVDLCLQGFGMAVMPSSNIVHKAYLEQYGYYLYPIPSKCPNCITVKEFSKLYPKGRYVLATGDHVVALVDGDYFDSFDSSNEIVSYIFTRKETNH